MVAGLGVATHRSQVATQADQYQDRYYVVDLPFSWTTIDIYQHSGFVGAA